MGKLTREDANEIRARRIGGWVSVADLAREKGVAPMAISRILRNETHFDPGYDPSKQARRPTQYKEDLTSDTGVPFEVPETRTPYVIYGLYCICRECTDTRPGEVRYVGQARRGLQHRMSTHFQKIKGSDIPADRWKVKHGRRNIRARVLEVVDTPDLLDAAEIRWIEEMGTLREPGGIGLNISLGGNSRTMSPEARARLSQQRGGDKSRFAILTWDTVKEVRGLVADGWNGAQIARHLGSISEGTIHSIIRNDTWFDPTYTPPRTRSRIPKGEDRTEAKLTWENVRYIRENNEKEAECAAKLGVSRALINLVRNNKVWHDPDYTPVKKTHPHTKGDAHHNSKITSEIAAQIRRETGIYREIGAKYGVSASLVMGIKLNRMWVDPDYTPPPVRGRGGRKRKVG